MPAPADEADDDRQAVAAVPRPSRGWPGTCPPTFLECWRDQLASDRRRSPSLVHHSIVTRSADAWAPTAFAEPGCSPQSHHPSTRQTTPSVCQVRTGEL